MNIPAFLEEKQCSFEVMSHPETYTAQELAHELHVSGRQVAKTVLLRARDGKDYTVAVLPAHKSVDLDRASELVGGREVELAPEKEIAAHCPDCETGALPPFGSHYGIQTILDEGLAEAEEIIFEGNTHSEAIRMKCAEFRRLEEPQVGRFAK